MHSAYPTGTHHCLVWAPSAAVGQGAGELYNGAATGTDAALFKLSL